jgi:hypothetical protein
VDILNAIALNFRTLTSIDIFAKIDSSASIIKIVECCRELETLKLWSLIPGLNLENADIRAIATLPRLKSLNIAGFSFGDGALSGLSVCRGLRHLALDSELGLYAVMPIIGGRLNSLEFRDCDASIVSDIVDHCPNLEYLVVRFYSDQGETDAFVDLSKSGLKRLAKLEMNGMSVCLFTVREGYDEDGLEDKNELVDDETDESEEGGSD